MAYTHIDNLYKNQDILMFKECYAMEKIHGTSARLSFNYETIEAVGFEGDCIEEPRVKYSSGGVKHKNFKSLFNEEVLLKNFKKLGIDDLRVYGEAYGGKCQGMKDTYGSDLKFVAFEVKIGDCFLSVPQAEEIVKELELEFVDYVKTTTDLKELDKFRDAFSTQAIRNGMGKHKREGIVLRPLIELRKNNGNRIIAKHKRDDFRETKSKRKVIDPNKLKVLKEANAVAEEWVTTMRLNHILDKIPNPDITDMRKIIKSMIADIKREGEKEIEWSKSIEKAIGRNTANMTKQYFKRKLKEKPLDSGLAY